MEELLSSLLSMDLSEAVLVAEGHMRLVYEHPALSGVLIKLIKPELIEDDGRLGGHYAAGSNRLKRMRRLGAFLTVKRELTEFLAVRVRNPVPAGEWPIQRILGFVDTEKGMGLLVEKLEDGEGGLAPTLHTLVTSGTYRPEHAAALDRFFKRLADAHVCVGNMHAKNIVYAGAFPNGRFVGVDGLGDKAAIPLADWSAWYNRRRIRHAARKIRTFIERSAAGASFVPDHHQQKNAGMASARRSPC